MAKIKTLAFNGSPRRQGNTTTLLAALGKGVDDGQGDLEIIRLGDLAIHPCTSCGGCDLSGCCILEDDMTAIYPKILAADRVVLASPIYFYGITAQAKALVDRTQALWNRQRLQVALDDARRSDPRRRGVLLAVAATKGAKVFDGAILTAKYAFNAMGLAYGGALLIRGLEGPDDAGRNHDALRRAEEFGYTLVR
ncbi:MAG: flavodoxin family protein [Desulfobulbaceae bacterium]|nr:MAG: flavodoxin family protein [Desulfobulbaceae bacterium]